MNEKHNAVEVVASTRQESVNAKGIRNCDENQNQTLPATATATTTTTTTKC